MIGKSFLKLNLLPVRQIPRATQQLAQNALGRPTGPDEFTLRRKDNSLVEVEIHTYPVKIDGRSIVLGVARDITGRKRTEESLQNREEQLRAILESTADGILVVDEQGSTVHSNNRFAELWQIPDELLATRDEQKMLDYVLNQLEDPQAFLARVQELYQSP